MMELKRIIKSKTAPKSRPGGLDHSPYKNMPLYLSKKDSTEFNRFAEVDQNIDGKQVVRQKVTKTIEKHFGNKHNRYRIRQTDLSKTFKFRTRQEDRHIEPISCEEFFRDHFKDRLKQLKTINEQYLKEFKEALMVANPSDEEGEFTREQRLAQQYSIIYEYRAISLMQDLP